MYKKLLSQILILLLLVEPHILKAKNETIFNDSSSIIYFGSIGQNSSLWSIAPNAQHEVGANTFLIYPKNNPNGPALKLEYNSNNIANSTPNIIHSCTVTNGIISSIDDSTQKSFRGLASVYTDPTKPTKLNVQTKTFFNSITSILNTTQETIYFGSVNSTNLTPLPGSSMPPYKALYPESQIDMLLYPKNNPNGPALLIANYNNTTPNSVISCTIKNGSIEGTIDLKNAQNIGSTPLIVTDATQPVGFKLEDPKPIHQTDANIFNDTQSILYIGTIGSINLTPIKAINAIHDHLFPARCPETYLIYPSNNPNGPALWFEYNSQDAKSEKPNYARTCTVTYGTPSFDTSEGLQFKGMAGIVPDSTQALGFTIGTKQINAPATTPQTVQANIYNNTKSTLYLGAPDSTKLSAIPAATLSPNNFLTVQTPGAYIIYSKNDPNGPALWLNYRSNSNSTSKEENNLYRCAVVNGKVYIREDAPLKQFMGSTYLSETSNAPGFLVR